MREWRILQQTVTRKQHEIAHLALDPVMLILSLKEATEAIFADVGLDRGWVAALARKGERPGIHVRGKNLHLRMDLMARGFLKKKHCYAIGLFAGSAADDPYSDRNGGVLLLEEF